MPSLRDSIDHYGKGKRMNEMNHPPFCGLCGAHWHEGTECQPGAREARAKRFHEALAKILERAGYTVTVPRPADHNPEKVSG